jgi:hypothetical protein
VLLKAGVVAVLNLNFNPEVAYSREILITHPERICFYDETKMELDFTRGGNGMTDRCLTISPSDDGIVVVTKSDKCASAVCGRLGDRRGLPVFTCFASGDSYAFAWASHYVCYDILDKDGNPIALRYISHVKGSITEESCAMYIEDGVRSPPCPRLLQAKII